MSQRGGWGAYPQQPYDPGFAQQVAALRQQLQADAQQHINRIAGGLRKEFQAQIERNMAASDKRLADMAKIAEALSAERHLPAPTGSAEGDIYIEQLPGKRIPFVYVVEIPIQADDMSPREGSFTVSPDGPFVAERRWAVFLSQFQFQYEDETTGQQVTLPGRSYGRYRPVHSASDYCDSQHNAQGDSSNWLITGAAGAAAANINSAVPGIVSTASSFRTMQFDGRIEMERASTDMRGQSRPMPTAWWSTETNGPVHLACLDLFPRSDGVTFRVTPNHVSNPPAGNATGQWAFPNVGASCWPFVEGQYDPHEGIATINAGTSDTDGWDPVQTDPVTRLPDGYLVIGLEGYRITQATGPQE